MGGHIPLVSEEHVERIRSWHEAAYAAARREGRSGQSFDYLWCTLVVPHRAAQRITLPNGGAPVPLCGDRF